jgi:hypothetical protein
MEYLAGVPSRVWRTSSISRPTSMLARRSQSRSRCRSVCSLTGKGSLAIGTVRPFDGERSSQQIQKVKRRIVGLMIFRLARHQLVHCDLTALREVFSLASSNRAGLTREFQKDLKAGLQIRRRSRKPSMDCASAAGVPNLLDPFTESRCCRPSNMLIQHRR